MFAAHNQQRKQSSASPTNHSVQRKSNPFFQRKPTVGPANDSYEQEADRVADAVVNGKNGQVQSIPISTLQRKEETDGSQSLQSKFFTSDTKLQRQIEEEEEETLQLKAMDQQTVQRQSEEEEEEEEYMQPKMNGGQQVSNNFNTQLSTKSGTGKSLSSHTAQKMGRAIGADFSNVTVHTDKEAAEMSQTINARAFTHGNDIYFNQNQYDPHSKEGQRLLAHELTHTVQQGSIMRKTIQREEFEDHEVRGSATGYEDQVTDSLRIAANRAGTHLNAYGIEVRNAIEAFESYATTRISSIGESIPGSGFINSIISIALSAVPTR